MQDTQPWASSSTESAVSLTPPLHEGGSAMHDVPVEPVFHQRRARTGEQHAGDVLAIALAGHDDDWGAHPLLLYTEMIFIYYALTLQS